MDIFDGGIEEIILGALFDAPGISTEDLIKRVERRRGGATKQGVYRVLRKLKRTGKVVIYKSSVSLNALWTERLRSLAASSLGKSIFADLSLLKPGERMVIEGKTLMDTDALWSEAFINIENKINSKHPLYLYNPHNWTILAQPDADKIHVDRLRHKQRPIFLSIGGRTLLDKETIKLALQDEIHASLSSSLRDRNSIVVIGDYILSVKFPSNGNILLDKIFREYSSPLEAGHAIKAASVRIRAKIFIENDRIKAARFKKKIARDFFIPKQNRDF